MLTPQSKTGSGFQGIDVRRVRKQADQRIPRIAKRKSQHAEQQTTERPQSQHSCGSQRQVKFLSRITQRTFSQRRNGFKSDSERIQRPKNYTPPFDNFQESESHQRMNKSIISPARRVSGALSKQASRLRECAIYPGAQGANQQEARSNRHATQLLNPASGVAKLF